VIAPLIIHGVGGGLRHVKAKFGIIYPSDSESTTIRTWKPTLKVVYKLESFFCDADIPGKMRVMFTGDVGEPRPR